MGFFNAGSFSMEECAYRRGYQHGHEACANGVSSEYAAWFRESEDANNAAMGYITEENDEHFQDYYCSLFGRPKLHNIKIELLGHLYHLSTSDAVDVKSTRSFVNTIAELPTWAKEFANKCLDLYCDRCNPAIFDWDGFVASRSAPSVIARIVSYLAEQKDAYKTADRQASIQMLINEAELRLNNAMLKQLKSDLYSVSNDDERRVVLDMIQHLANKNAKLSIK